MKRIIYIYMITALVCFSIAGAYAYIENCYSDETFDAKTSIEKQLHLRYCVDAYSLNPYDSFTSKLEYYLIYVCWVLGAWNLMDVLLAFGMKNIHTYKPEDCLMWNIINSKTYKKYCKKIKKPRKVKKLWQTKNQNQNQNQKFLKEK